MDFDILYIVERFESRLYTGIVRAISELMLQNREMESFDELAKAVKLKAREGERFSH